MHPLSSLYVNPRRTCAARVTVVGFVCLFVCLSVCLSLSVSLSVKPHLSSGVSVCPEINVTYSTCSDSHKNLWSFL